MTQAYSEKVTHKAHLWRGWHIHRRGAYWKEMIIEIGVLINKVEHKRGVVIGKD